MDIVNIIIWGIALVIATAVAFVVVAKSRKRHAASTGGAKTTKKTQPLSTDLVELDLGSALTRQVQEALAADETLTVAKALTDLIPSSTAEDKDGLKTILFVGVNGVGKTTTVGKIANLLAKDGSKVVLAAADTFRAAAAEQLQTWGQKASKNSGGSVEVVVAQTEGQDPASVAFQASQKALADGADYLLIDTAGRQQTNQNLMQELEKIKRVVEKNTPVDEVHLVVDATTGQTALQQALKFNEAVDITGLVVTKLDGSTRGGVLILVSNALGVAPAYIGVGEGVEDLKVFDREEFIDSL